MVTTQQYVPALRFRDEQGREYPDWEETRIDSICEINPYCGDFPIEFLYIDLESVLKGSLIKQQRLSKDDAPSRAQRVLKKRDVLFQTVRPYQQNNYYFDLDGNYVASTGYAQLRASGSSKFLYFLLHSESLLIGVLARCTGTSYPAINANDLGKIRTAFPTIIEEQQKIAAFLSSVDATIEQLNKKKSLLEQYKKGLMQKLFSQEIRFKDERGEEYPDWEDKELGTTTNIYDGTHQTPRYVKEGVPFYSVEHVTADQFSETKFISENSFKQERERARLEKGDILMTRIGSVGAVKFIDWDVRASFYVSLALIKKSPKFNTRFLAQYIKCQSFQRELWKRTIHVAFPKKINLGEIGNCLITLPCSEEQQKIGNFLSAIDKKIEFVIEQITQAQTFKKGLLQQMFI